MGTGVRELGSGRIYPDEEGVEATISRSSSPWEG